MIDLASGVIVTRIHQVHGWLLKSVDGMSEAQFVNAPNAAAPPIGWHLWHTARGADRLQASLPRNDDAEHVADPDNDIWSNEHLVEAWGLDGDRLGKLQSGTRMDGEYAAQMIQQVGMPAIVDYVTRVLSALDEAVDGLSQEQLDAERISIMYDPNVHSPTKETTTIADLGFHFSHANRHLGSIEALRGLSGEPGTVSA